MVGFQQVFFYLPWVGASKFTKRDFTTTLPPTGVLTTGWWFGTSFLFSHTLGMIFPIDGLIFFRGVQTTNQTSKVKHPTHFSRIYDIYIYLCTCPADPSRALWRSSGECVFARGWNAHRPIHTPKEGSGRRSSCLDPSCVGVPFNFQHTCDILWSCCRWTIKFGALR